MGANGATDSSHFALGVRFGWRAAKMGSTPSHEHDDTSERGVHANITIDVFLVGKPRTDMSPFEPRG